MERTTTTRIYESDREWLVMEQRKRVLDGQYPGPTHADIIRELIEKERGNGS